MFLLRSRMINVKVNFSEKYMNNKLFKICKEESESQEHVLKCKEIHKQAGAELGQAQFLLS